MRKVNLDKIEVFFIVIFINFVIQTMTDNMQDLMEEANEINQLLGDAYGQEVFDEDELMAGPQVYF